MASSAQNAPDGGISRSGEFEGPVDLSGVSAASFALWVRWESEDGVAMSWVRGSDGKYMSLGLEGGRFRLYNDSQSAVYPTTPVAVLGEWYSVVVVTDGTGEGLYINGVSVGTGAVALAVFAIRGQVLWIPGLIITVGTVIGVRLSVGFAIKANADTLRIVLLLAVIGACVAAFFR